MSHPGFRLAIAAAMASNHQKSRHGAVLTIGSRIIASANNDYGKTHAGLRKWFPYAMPHAESLACLKAGLDRCQGATLTVIRIRTNGQFGLSRPCPCCQQMMKDLGIKRCWFTNDTGDLIFDR